jgi:transposase
LPAEHLVYFILDLVEELDLKAIEGGRLERDARGEKPYHPRMMVGLLLYAYCVGVYSSRRIERGTYEDVAMRVLSGGEHPHFTTVNEFRRVHRQALAGLFIEVLKLCQRAGLVKLGHVAVDGTKVKASASKHKAMSYERMVKSEQKLGREIEELLSRADEVDAAEDRQYGVGKREWELPAELQRREERLKRLRAAKEELEREAREVRAEELRQQADGLRQSAAQQERPQIGKMLLGQAARREADAKKLGGRDDHNDPGPPASSTELPQRQVPVTAKGDPKPGAQRNFTDPESHLMMGNEGYIQGYNCQVAVDDKAQVIVACGVTNQPPDNGQLVPMLERVKANCGRASERATADAGYWNAQAAEQAAKVGTQVLIATKRVRHGQAGPAVTEGPPPAGLDALGQMKHRLNTPEGRALYARRKAVVEPAIGQIKNRGFRRFSFRGLRAVAAEWGLVCACHNLLKLFRSGGWPVLASSTMPG